ncbi:MAG: hypothetical protein KME23_09170 [Goleter apudmare HA4340-LM2]|nr:hypothetical protein [Goleter apudmare HA4340-LM2]
MTKYSMPANTPPETLGNHKADNYSLETDDYPLEVDSTAWELRMAQLFGLEAESPPVDLDIDEDLAESVNLQPSPSQPVEEKTEQSLSSNPFAKLGLVGAGTLGIVLLAGIFLSQLMGGTNQKPKAKNIVPEIQAPAQPSGESELAAKVETLKTKLALTEQAAAVKLAQQQLRNVKPASPPVSAVPQNSQPRQPIQRTPTPTATVYVPRIVTVERVVRVPYPQPAPSPQPITPAPVSVTPQPTPSPSPTPQSPPEIASSRPVDQEPNNQPEEQIINPQPEPTPKAPTSNLGQALRQSPKSVAVGSQAKAVLATAVFGETTKSANSDNKNAFVVRLKEPLKSVDGTIALPANTEFLAEIRTLSDQGLLQLNVVKLMLSEQGKVTERSLPENAIAIRAPQGRPLIANQFPNRGSSIASMDVGLFVLGGLGKAAELINRSEAQVVTTTSGGTIVSNTNPQRNLLAGALEGGMNTVVPQISQRNQQAISQLSQRTNVWFLPAGTSVEIYINQVIEL